MALSLNYGGRLLIINTIHTPLMCFVVEKGIVPLFGKVPCGQPKLPKWVLDGR
jgi:hypothetical protein